MITSLLKRLPNWSATIGATSFALLNAQFTHRARSTSKRKKEKEKKNQEKLFSFFLFICARERSSFSARFFVLIVSLRFAKVPPSAPIFKLNANSQRAIQTAKRSTMTLQFNRHLVVDFAMNTIEDGPLCKEYNISTEKISVCMRQERQISIVTSFH